MKRLTKEQRRDMLDIIHAINAQDYREAEELLAEAPTWFAHWPLWSAGENMPGCMPDTLYSLFLTERAARGHCRELEREPDGGSYVSDYMPTTLAECIR